MDQLAQVCERIASHNSRLKKVEFLAAYLRGLSDADLARAVRFLTHGPIQADASGTKFSVGRTTLREAALLATGLDPAIYAVCYRDVGDTGETVSLLLHGKTADLPLTLAEAELIYARLYKMRRTQDKVDLLRDTLVRHRPAALKYFLKVITGGLRMGLLTKQVEEAIAAATGADLQHVRNASNVTGDLPRVALAARAGTLLELEARLFHVMDFMLAKPLDAVADLDAPADWWVEDKYDGFRSQVHTDRERAVIFTRGMEEVTGAFPELAESFRRLREPAILDGEILAWQDGRALSFNVLQQRIARKKVTPELMAEVPVVFVAYDLLYSGGGMQLDQPIETRRARMAELIQQAADPRLLLAPQWRAESADAIEQAFADARARGNEGLVLKRAGSLYEPSRRSGTWLKVKKPYGTLDVVITAAEQGSGKRAIYLSDYTFGVRTGGDDARFLNVGKAYSGLTDEEIRELTRILRAATVERYGRVALVRPEVVLEVAFDGIQKSSRHKGGYALRFPRIVRWRRDKTAADADSIDRVRELYEASVAR